MSAAAQGPLQGQQNIGYKTLKDESETKAAVGETRRHYVKDVPSKRLKEQIVCEFMRDSSISKDMFVRCEKVSLNDRPSTEAIFFPKYHTAICGDKNGVPDKRTYFCDLSDNFGYAGRYHFTLKKVKMVVVYQHIFDQFKGKVNGDFAKVEDVPKYTLYNPPSDDCCNIQ